MSDYATIRTKMCAMRLKELRERMELSQREMAKKLKVSTASVYNYETGKRTPTLEYLTVVAKTFNVNFEWITGGNVDDGKTRFDELYAKLTDEEREELMLYAQFLIERRKYNGG